MVARVSSRPVHCAACGLAIVAESRPKRGRLTGALRVVTGVDYQAVSGSPNEVRVTCPRCGHVTTFTEKRLIIVDTPRRLTP